MTDTLNQIIQNGELRALTLKQPYSDLMILRGKIETRSWRTNYRGWVLLCNAQQPYDIGKVEEISGLDTLVDIIATIKTFVPLGHAFAVGNLVNCRPMLPEDEKKCFVLYKPGLYCFEFAEVQPIEPFAYKGGQRLRFAFRTEQYEINILP